MSIRYNEAAKSFLLTSKDTTYVIGIFDDDQYVCHLYYGKKLPDEEVNYLYGPLEKMRPSILNRERARFMDVVPLEYPTHGVGDYREHCLEVETVDGYHTCDLHYVSHTIYAGKPALPDMPATFDHDDVCTTLELRCRDHVLNLGIVLIYTTFENLDVITRTVRVENHAEQPIYLKRVFSAALDFDHQNFDVLTLHGGWARECNPTRVPVFVGKHVSGNARGETSAQDSPLLAILDPDTNDDQGEVFAMNFVYSGNFYACAEGHQYGGTRAVMGINPQNFTWKLEPGDSFTAPEVVMVHSDEGLGKMTRTFHDLYRKHLIRGKYIDKKRPILINNWEATYFDFSTEKLLSIAREAAKNGIEMLVMDDGWFGARNNDDRGLGDWVVNEEKLPGGLGYLVDEVNKLGMKFGIWIEPEMVNANSDLFRAHPDWAIQIPGRRMSEYRQQLILDWSRKEVRDYVYGMIHKVLSSANIEYVKWDMNRTMTEIGGADLPADRQQELSHRYVLGVYDIMNRLTTDFPNILLENCSSGGSRFDAGMLYYSPQIWTSDDTDAIERLGIQYGTSLCYPLSTMGAHVSAVPNHQTGRVVPFETRGYVALSGTFGYELDVTRIPEEDRAMIPEQVAMYHKYNDLIREGDLYRSGSVYTHPDYDCWTVVAKDKSEALLTYIQVHAKPGFIGSTRKIHFKGLCPETMYRDEESGVVASGAAWMNGGYWMDNVPGDFVGKLVHLVKA